MFAHSDLSSTPLPHTGNTPGRGGPGNTHASRTGFYHLNHIKDIARQHLPNNSWLQARLRANVNINSSCNAFWNGDTVNFYNAGGGCRNTAEISGVIVHEWGHGMDANDVSRGISRPSGEGIADVYAALYDGTSCMGRGFFSSNCNLKGDGCTDCTGVRDIDYMKHVSGKPHTMQWSNANCGGNVHCVGHVYSEAIWSLYVRKFPQLGYDDNTSKELTTNLLYKAAGNVAVWFSGNGNSNGGCFANSGYFAFLAADDDNGNINDGTPRECFSMTSKMLLSFSICLVSHSLFSFFGLQYFEKT